MATDPAVIAAPPPPAAAATESAAPGAGGKADTASAATVTERNWDGWPTPPTPEYLVPGMGKVPVSSTVHFQTVAMTSMGGEVPAGQLRQLGAELVRRARIRRDRQWTLDAAGSVTVTTVPVDAAATAPDDSELATMLESLRTDGTLWRSWSAQWQDRVFQSDREAQQQSLSDIRAMERALEQDASASARAALREAQQALVVTMWQRQHEAQADRVRADTVADLLAHLLRPPLFNWLDVVTRLEAAGLTGPDIYVGDDPGVVTVQDALNALFSFIDEGRLDPLAFAEPDAMDSPAEGVLLHQEQGWFARGLALGNLLHSVALAPGEVTQIAMTHWNHSTRASDSETVSQQDSTAESDTQDRAVTEVQQAAAREHAGGGSVATSLGTAAQGGYSGFGVTASGGMSNNLSTAVTFSDGSKDLSMTSNQHVAAVTQRHAEAARTRRATVVREVSQNEAQDLTTRVLANYNHMHALTVMYFEVIEVFDLKTRVVDADRLIFLPYVVRDVEKLIPRFRAVLMAAANAAGKPELADAIGHFKEPQVNAEGKPELADAIGHLKEQPLQLEELDARIAELDGSAADAASGRAATSGEIARIEKKLAALRKDIQDLPKRYVQPRGALETAIEELTAKSSATLAAYKEAPAYLGAAAAQAVQSRWQQIDAQVRQIRSELDASMAAETSALAQLQDERVGTERLLESLRLRSSQLKDSRRILQSLAVPDHKGPLHDHKLFFNQAVWLSLSPGEVLGLAKRRYMFRGELLCEHIDPAPVAITGNYVAYRWRFDDAVKGQQFRQRYVEPFVGDPDHELATVKTTIAVPTGGVFGEAVLGQAVSAEKIDLSRFWNWKDSMIPILPTNINPLTATTATAQALSAEPGKLDESSAKLGALQDLPAPSGFQALAETMRAQLFRDMSGQTMLQSLALATTQHAAAGATEAGKVAQENFKAGLAFAKEMAPMVMKAMAAPETGGASLMAGKLNAAEGGGTSLLGGMLNAKGAAGAEKLLAKLGGDEDKKAPTDPKIPEDELEEVDTPAAATPPPAPSPAPGPTPPRPLPRHPEGARGRRMEDLKTFAEAVQRGQNFGDGHVQALYKRLGTLAAWDAVIEFALAARALSTAWAEALHAIPWKKSFSKFVSRDDTRVHGPAEMRQVPVGAFIAFISVDEPDAYFTFIGKRWGRRRLVHAMVSLGGGLAAGVGNRRGIGIGNDGGWEVLDLALLCTWRGGSIPGVALGAQAARPLHVRYRPLAAFQGATSHVTHRVAIDNLTLDLLKRVSLQAEDGLIAQPGPDWSIAAAAGTADLRLVRNTALFGGSWQLTRGGIGWAKTVYFLPYCPRHIAKLQIGGQCQVFVTAALTGCSIFASGDPATPTLFHAGLIGSVSAAAFQAGTLNLVDDLDQLFHGPQHSQARAALVAAGKDDKPAFWNVLLDRLEPHRDPAHASEVNKNMYNDGSARARAVVDRVIAAHRADGTITWIKSQGAIGSAWGAYLGFLQNGAWVMYMQENLTFNYQRRGTREVYLASFPIALTQVYPPGREGTNLIASVPDRIADPFTPSDTVVRSPYAGA